MLRNSVRLFTVAGIEVGVHFSWLIIFGLVTWSLATGFFPDIYGQVRPGQQLDDVTAWLLAAISALLLFGSVLVHELAHSFVARARGLEAKSITLFIFGGVSNLGGESKDPATEFLVAVVGPLTSFAIAGVAFVVALLIGDPVWEIVVSYLAVVNLLLGAFNLIPGFPLDGGRVFRSIVWKITNSLRRATEIASTVGQLVGYGFIAWGLWILLASPRGNFLGGLWIGAIGWFLQNAASASRQQVVIESRLRDVRVADVLRQDPASVTPDTTVADLIEEHLLPRNRRAMVVCEGSEVSGIVTLGDIQRVPVDERATTPVGQVMTQRPELAVVGPRATLWEALQQLGDKDVEQAPVVEDGRFLGLLTRADIIRQLQLRELLGRGQPE